ncbi:MAG TPA: M67 family metallopeptidase [Alphaproteobacteria bacterium]|jgi:proteasome lid subunit RPN8/RPN11
MNRLLLDADRQAALKRHAIDAYPKECCGLLVGHERDGDLVVSEIVPSRNLDAAGGARAFEVDPALILDWQKRLRGGPERIIGHYHSHPDEHAEPSATDLARAWEPGQVWLIMTVLGGLPAEGVIGPLVGPIMAFRYAEEGADRAFEPLELAAP